MLLRTLVLLGLASGALAASVRSLGPPRDDEDYESSEEDQSRDETVKVYGGNYAAPGMFPFMVVIHRLVTERKFVVCGGTIIAKRWVLTAGHCVKTKPREPRQFLLAFGVVDKSIISYDRVMPGGGVSMVSVNAFVHPGFADGANDIGLVHAPRNIPFSVTIKPIRLAGASYASETFEGMDGGIFGWGQEGRDKPSAKLLSYGQATILSKSECRSYWRGVSDDHICTTVTKGQDVCQGDSGGPLVIMEEDEPVQIGIVSFGDAECPSWRPAVWTRVSSFQSWISEVTGIVFDEYD